VSLFAYLEAQAQFSNKADVTVVGEFIDHEGYRYEDYGGHRFTIIIERVEHITAVSPPVPLDIDVQADALKTGWPRINSACCTCTTANH
jgi:hypothetical protein